MTARFRQVALVPALSVVLALLVGAVIMILTSPMVVGSFSLLLPLEAYAAMIGGAFGSLNAIVNTLVNATPLLLAGLGVGIGFKGGLFNIGAPGQIAIGALTGTAIAVALNDASPLIAIPAAVIGGVVYGLVDGIVEETANLQRSAPRLAQEIEEDSRQYFLNLRFPFEQWS